MSHFAKVCDGIVVSVIVADQEYFESFIDSSPGEWIQTSYNGSIRKNFAGIGYSYDHVRDAFIPPKPDNDWVLDESTCLWKAP